MLAHYVRTAVRAARRQRGFTTINLVGLTFGLTCSLLLFAFVREELAYDRGWPEADRLVRVVRRDSSNGQVFTAPVVPGEVGRRIRDLFPAVAGSVQLSNVRVALQVDVRQFELSTGFVWTDSGAFTVLGLELQAGDPATALSGPRSVVLSPALAARLFGDADPIGRIVRVDARHDLTVTGILRPPGFPTHMTLEALGSRATLEPFASPWVAENQGWTYLRLAPGAAAGDVERDLNAHLDEIVTWFNLDVMDLYYELQPIEDIRLHSAGITAPGRVSDLGTVRLFALVGLAILLMACVNFMNLATARAARRSLEVGLRKTLGASRRQVVAQFLAESVGMSAVAVALSLLVIRTILPWFNDLAGTAFAPGDFLQGGFVAAVFGIALAAGVVAGSYPALYLSGFSPIRVIRGSGARGGHASVRRGLVVVQFAISSALILSTVVIRDQMAFVRDEDPGFEAENLVVLRTSGIGDRADALRDALSRLPFVTSVSVASGLPVGGSMQSSGEINGHDVVFHRYLVDDRYLDASGIRLVAGRNYLPDSPADGEASVIVNETYVRLRGWTDPIGREVAHGVNEDGSARMATVIGVVEDFHTGSLHEEIMPARLDAQAAMAGYRRSMLVRMKGSTGAERIAGLTRVWSEMAPDLPVSFYFADDVVRAQYAAEARASHILLVFTLLAVAIACLGVFGLSAHSAERRTKEIGVRKALGATVAQVAGLLSGEFVRLVAVSLVVGIPVALWATARWLETFAYRIDTGPTHLVATAGAMLALTVIAVAGQAVRAARLDPAACLRSE